jgi:hypothetical protein
MAQKREAVFVKYCFKNHVHLSSAQHGMSEEILSPTKTRQFALLRLFHFRILIKIKCTQFARFINTREKNFVINYGNEISKLTIADLG